MLVFIDESGDAGINGSPIFVIAMVIFKTEEDARATDEAIETLKKNKKQKSELKFTKCRADIRNAFFAEMQKQSFRIKAVIVKKEIIRTIRGKKESEISYKYFLKELMKRANLKNARIRLDGIGGGQSKKLLPAYLKDGQKNMMYDFKFKDSRKDNLIQCADMVAGAIARSYAPSKPNDTKWREMLRFEEGDLWEYR